MSSKRGKDKKKRGDGAAAAGVVGVAKETKEDRRPAMKGKAGVEDETATSVARQAVPLQFCCSFCFALLCSALLPISLWCGGLL